MATLKCSHISSLRTAVTVRCALHHLVKTELKRVLGRGSDLKAIQIKLDLKNEAKLAGFSGLENTSVVEPIIRNAL